MTQFETTSPVMSELRATLSLAWPMVLTNLAQHAMAVTDIIMLSRLGPDALAGSAVAINLYYLTFFLGFGLMLAVAPVLAKEVGAFKYEVRRVRQTVRHGLWLGLLVPLPLMYILWHGETLLLLSGQEPKIAALGGTYLHTFQWAMIPYFLFIVLRNFVSALQRPKPAMIISLCAIAFNALANWLLIFGHWGFPKMGLQGSGLATAFTCTMMFLALTCFVLWDRRFARYHLFGRFWRLDAKQFWHLVQLGLNIGLLLLFETALFGVSGLLMGQLGRDSVAAYAIALQLASITFMIPLGVGQAATVRVGLAFGAQQPDQILRAGWTSFWLGTGFMVFTALMMVLIPEILIGLFLDRTDPAMAPVFALAVSFLSYAALFQIVDGAQAVANGMLRGVHDTKLPLVIGGIGYWVLGMPIGWLLAFRFGHGGAGIWLGLAFGLAFVAVALIWRWIVVTRRLKLQVSAA